MLSSIKNKKPMQKIIGFYDSIYYPICIFIVVLITHCLALDVVGIAITFLSLAFSNLFCDDIRPSLPVIFMAPYVVSTQNSPGYNWSNDYYSNPIVITIIAIICVIAILSIIFRVVVYKEYKNLFKKRSLLLGFLLLVPAYILAGAFSKYYNLDNILVIALLIFVHTLGYLLYSVSMKSRKDNLEYLAKISVLSLILIAIEVGFVYLLRFDFSMSLDSDWKNLIVLGMLVSNSAGAFMAIFLPFCFYLCCTQKKGFIYYFIAIFAMIAIYFTLSRTALLFSAPVFVLGSVIVCFFGKYKKICRIILGCIFGVGLVILGLLIYKGYLTKLLAFFISAGFKDRARFKIWGEVLSYFTENPIFGGGFSAYFTNHKESLGFIFQSFAHNTVVQIIGSTGLFGILCFLYHRFEIFKMFFKNINFSKFFIFLSFIVFLLCGLLDQIFVLPNFAIIYTILLVFAEKEGEESKEDKNQLIKGE